MSQKYTEQLRQLAETERRRLESGGFTLNLEELQQNAHDFANENAELEIQAFRILEKVNEREKNRRLWDKKYHLFNAIGHNREVHRIQMDFEQTQKLKKVNGASSMSITQLKQSHNG